MDKYLDEFEVARQLDEAGWNPLQPSAQCIAATPSPSAPYYLDRFDRTAIHRKLLEVDLIVRFPDLLYRKGVQSARVIATASTLHAIRASGASVTSQSIAWYQAWLERLRAWEVGRLAESDERLRAAGSLDEIESEPERFEPSYTLTRLIYERRWIDFSGNRRSVAKAMGLVERQGVLRKQHSQVDRDMKEILVSDADVDSLLDTVLAEKPDCHLFYPSSPGKFRLGPEELRDRMNGVFGAVQPVRDHSQFRVEGGYDEQSQPSSHLEDSEEVLRVRALLRERKEKATSKSEALAAEHFQAIVERGVRPMARSLHVPRVQLDRAFRKIREELRRNLSA